MNNRLPGEDRRKFQRLKVNLSVCFELDGNFQLSSLAKGQEVEATTLDLGCGGMAIASKYDVPVAAQLRIRFHLFKTDNKGITTFYEPIEAVGQVRSNIALEHGFYRLGICFEEISVKDSLEIHHFVTMVHSA